MSNHHHTNVGEIESCTVMLHFAREEQAKHAFISIVEEISCQFFFPQSIQTLVVKGEFLAERNVSGKVRRERLILEETTITLEIIHELLAVNPHTLQEQASSFHN
jgi:hypothetical protein